MSPRLLIAGIGNIFLGDDGFGSEMARRLLGRSWPEGTRVVDFGIRGVDLTYALLDGYDAVILIDVTCRGKSPGTLYVIEPELDDIPRPESGLGLGIDLHGMDPTRVLGTVRAMGGELRWLRLVGCEPASFGGEEGAMGLTPAVAAALDGAVALVENLVREAASSIAHA